MVTSDSGEGLIFPWEKFLDMGLQDWLETCEEVWRMQHDNSASTVLTRPPRTPPVRQGPLSRGREVTPRGAWAVNTSANTCPVLWVLHKSSCWIMLFTSRES